MNKEKKILQKSFEIILFEKKRLEKDLSTVISEKKALEEKVEELVTKPTPQNDQQEVISKLTSENDYLKKFFERFSSSQISLDAMLVETRRSHNLAGLGYSSQKYTTRTNDHVASTSKNHISYHSRKQHHYQPRYHHQHHAPNRYYHHKTNHAGVSYKSVSMTAERYEKINNRSDYSVIHDTQNTYRRFKYKITIQPKDFKAM